MGHIFKTSLVFAFLVGIMPFQSLAQKFEVFGDGKFAEVTGGIEIDSDERFLEFLNTNSDLVALRLNSPGGVVVSALAMAEQISQRQLATYVGATDICASACSILFFSGYERLVEGRLGVHQMDDGGKANASVLQFLLARQLDAFLQYDVPWALTRKMLITPPSEMYWITETDIKDYGLNRNPSVINTAAATKDMPSLGYDVALRGFADFPPSEVLVGEPRLPDFSGRDIDYRMYRTRIGNAAAQGVNFGGQYTMVEIGCGTSCRFAFVVDVTTGEVGSFPYGGEEQYQMGLLYAPDSRFLKVRWKLGWDNDKCMEKDMVLENLEWQEIAERIVPALNGYCSDDV